MFERIKKIAQTQIHTPIEALEEEEKKNQKRCVLALQLFAAKCIHFDLSGLYGAVERTNEAKKKI